MSTGGKFVNVTNKRILGTDDFGERMIDYMRALVTDMMDVAFGMDGVFGGAPIQISGFGVNQAQLDTDATCSDGAGHFLKTDAALAGRDQGLDFENADTIVYDLALHYAERPRSVQINPRTANPEFVAWEESVGIRDEPGTAVDNADGTMTFNVDSVCSPFGDIHTHAGRRVLVWKKVPGALAVTEATAVELCTVAFGGGANTITTSVVGSGGAGTFGQGAGPSEDETAYFAMLFGPLITVESETDLRAQAGYTFIGTIVGAVGAAPTVFDMGDQNDLASGFAVDLNEITRPGTNGDLKIRVRAEALDANEKQLEAQNASGTSTWYVDEDGDQVNAGTSQFTGAANFDSTVAMDGPLTVGADRLSTHAAAAGARVSAPYRAVAGAKTLDEENLPSTGTVPGFHSYRFHDGKITALTINAKWNEGATRWDMDDASAISYKFELGGGGFTFWTHPAAANFLDGDWVRGQLDVDTIRMGSNLLATAVAGAIPRINLLRSGGDDNTARIPLIGDSGDGASTSQIYLSNQPIGSGGPNNGNCIQFVLGASWNATSQEWDPQVAAEPTLLELSANGLILYTTAETTSFPDSDWNGLSTGYYAFSGAEARPRANTTSATDISFGVAGETSPEDITAGAFLFAPSAPECLFIPVRLPHGVKIDGCKFGHLNVAGNGETRVALVRHAYVGEVNQSFKTGTPYDVLPTTGAATVAVSFDLTINESDLIVDNEQYAYYIWVRHSSTNAGLRISGGRVAYTQQRYKI